MRPRLLAPGTVSTRCKPAGRLGFGFGRRFFLLILLGTLWCVPAFWSNKFLLIMAAWDACVFAAWAVDLWLLPRPIRLMVERSWTGPASLSNNVDIHVQVQNANAIAALVNVIDRLRTDVDARLTAVEKQLTALNESNQLLTELITTRLPPPTNG